MSDDERPGVKERLMRQIRHQTSTQRDLDSKAARAVREAKRERDRLSTGKLDQIQDLADDIEEKEDASTGVIRDEWEGVSTGVTPRIKEDPDLYRLYAKIDRGLKRERSKRASDIMAAMGEKPPAEVMSKLEKTIRRLKWIIIAIAIPAGSSAVLVGKYLTERAAANERALIERQQLIDKVNDHERTIKMLHDLASRNAVLIESLERRDRRKDRDSTPNKVEP